MVSFYFQESSSKMINYMDNATKVCQGNVKFISIFAGGVEEMESRQNEGRPSFVLHGENFPKNLPEILTDFEKMLKTFEPTDNQDCLYEILENSNTSGNILPYKKVYQAKYAWYTPSATYASACEVCSLTKVVAQLLIIAIFSLSLVHMPCIPYKFKI